MIRTGDEYRESLRDGRSVWIDGEKVDDVAAHPAFKPIVDVRARIYDMAHDPATTEAMSYVDAETGERCPTGARPFAEQHAVADLEVDRNQLAGLVTAARSRPR